MLTGAGPERRAGSSRPATPTRARCASTWRPLRLVGDAARAARQRPRRRTPRSASARATPLKRAASPALVRAGAALSGQVLRLDLHPADFDHPRHVLARRAGAQARAAPGRGHLRRPVLNTRPRPSCARTGARAPAATARRSRFTCPVAAALQAPVVLGLLLPRDRLDARRPRRARKQELRTLLRAGRADGFIPHTAFWQAPPRWRRAPLYATAALPRRHRHRRRSRRRCWRWRGSASRTATTRSAEEGLEPLPSPRPLADRPARPRPRRPDHDPAARRVRPRRLAQVRRRLRLARALQARLRAARAALPARALERARRSPAPPTSTSRTSWSTSPTRSRCARCTACPATREWAEHATRTEPALLERCWDAERGLFFDLAGRDERRVEVSTWSSLAPLALEGIPREIRERLADEHLLNPRRYRARFGVPSVSMEEPASAPASTPTAPGAARRG